MTPPATDSDECKHDGALDVHADGRHTCEDCGARVEFTEEFDSAAEAIAGRRFYA
jgi:hypothetical protein